MIAQTDWTTRTLGDSIDFITSGSRGWAKYYADSGAVFLRIQNVGRNKMLLDDVAYVDAPDTTEAKRTRVEPGDVLLSVTADLGRAAVVPDDLGPAHINQHLVLIRVTDIHPQYLAAYLSSPDAMVQFQTLNREGVKAALNFDDVRSLKIPLPPLSEQKRIAGILDQADGLRRKRQQALSLTDQFLRSTFLDLFGDPVTNPKQWPVDSLSTFANVTGGFAFKSTWFSETGRKVIRISNIRDGGIDTSSAVRIDERSNPVSDDFTARTGDVLMALSGATTGKLGAVRDADDGLFVNQRIAIIRANTRSRSDYLSWALKDRRLIDALLKTADGSAQANLSPNRLRECQIPRPDDSALSRFSTVAMQSASILAKATNSLHDAERLFTSLVQRAFRGEL